MKAIVIVSLLFCTELSVGQNVAVNNTGANADPSAMLDVTSTTKGFLGPRMTSAQRMAIPSPAEGLFVYDTDTKSFWFFSTTWKEINLNGAVGSFALPYSGSSSEQGKLFSLANSSYSGGATAIYGRAGNNSSGSTFAYNIGVWGDNSTGIGAAGTSNFIGVLGQTGVNDTYGIGVYGQNHSNTNAAITGFNDMSGGAVRGIFSGTAGKTGIGVLGETGAYGGWGTAGKFISHNSNDVTPTVHIINNGSQLALNVESNNATNTVAAFMVNHAGTGSLASFKKSGIEKVSISNTGNITTSGTVTVKNNNGIVRNTGSAQMRIEVLTVSIGPLNFQHYDVNFGAPGTDVTIPFSTPFSSPPAVYIANTLSGNAWGLTKGIEGVTASGFKFVIANFGPYDFTGVSGSFKIVAIGNE